MASAIHRTTHEYRESAHTPDLGADWLVNPDLSAVAGVARRFWKVSGNAVVAMTEAERLPVLKADKIAAINARTEQLLGAGFEYPPASGKRFALDVEARTLILGLVISKESLAYPQRYNTQDQTGFHDLADAADVASFYGAALVTVKTHQDSGTALKDAVRAAATIAELEAVADNR